MLRLSRNVSKYKVGVTVFDVMPCLSFIEFYCVNVMPVSDNQGWLRYMMDVCYTHGRPYA